MTPCNHVYGWLVYEAVNSRALLPTIDTATAINRLEELERTGRALL